MNNIYTYTFKKTIPVLVRFVFLGMAYGILMETQGFSILWSLSLSILVYAGSLQYAAIPMLVAHVNPLYALLMALMINARHLFYGMSMLSKYSNVRNKFYLIFGLTDETFSIVCNEEVPEQFNKDLFYLLVTLFNQLYWVIGTLLGGLLGSFITFNTTGLDFALTALFIVIFTNQWISHDDHFPALLGLIGSMLCLYLFGPDSFIIPSMIVIIVVLTIKYYKEVCHE